MNFILTAEKRSAPGDTETLEADERIIQAQYLSLNDR